VPGTVLRGTQNLLIQFILIILRLKLILTVFNSQYMSHYYINRQHLFVYKNPRKNLKKYLKDFSTIFTNK